MEIRDLAERWFFTKYPIGKGRKDLETAHNQTLDNLTEFAKLILLLTKLNLIDEE